jgi:hypothetical protein
VCTQPARMIVVADKLVASVHPCIMSQEADAPPLFAVSRAPFAKLLLPRAWPSKLPTLCAPPSRPCDGSRRCHELVLRREEREWGARAAGTALGLLGMHPCTARHTKSLHDSAGANCCGGRPTPRTTAATLVHVTANCIQRMARPMPNPVLCVLINISVIIGSLAGIPYATGGAPPVSDSE